MKDLLHDLGINKIEIKVNIVGSRLGGMPQEIEELAQDIVSKTKNHKSGTLNICIGYGGREEILDAVMAASKWLRKNPTITKLPMNIFQKFLLIPQSLDIVIRTGGEQRLSGFMLYQVEYAELFFTDTLWPDFTTKELDRIIEKFSQIDRRFGK